MKGEDEVLISERSLLTDRMVFAWNSFECGLMGEAERRVYENWFKYLDEQMRC
jgi:hypothetical protein